MTTYSLWVALEPQAERGIAKIIHAAAQRLQTPSFLPHMTLLGGISVRQFSRSLADVRVLELL